MDLLADCTEWLDFCDDLVRELTDSKCDDFKRGQIDGLKMATDMLRGYLQDYPDFVDPINKYDKFKM